MSETDAVDRRRVTVIVPVFNEERRIALCLEALLRQAGVDPLEIFVVDDGSTDDTVEVARRFPVRVLTQAHQGPAAARNLGARQASGDILLFTDADCQPEKNWAAVLMGALENPSVVGARGVHRAAGRKLMAKLAQVEYEAKFAKLGSHETIDFVDTNCAAYRRDVFLAAGGFNDTLAAAEDIELSFMLAKDGKRLVFVPGAVVYHDHTDSLVKYLVRKTRFGYWRVRVYARYPERMAGDSYTPRSLQVQFALTWLSLPLLALGWVHPAIILAALAALLGFSATAASYVVRGWREGPLVAVAMAPLLYLRSIALGVGLVLGVLDRIPRPGGCTGKAGIS